MGKKPTFFIERLLFKGIIKKMEGLIIDKIKESMKPLLDDMGLVIVDMQLKKGRGSGFLKILVDKKEGGITAADCVEANERIGLLLDESNLLEGSYLLEVSSPGIDRPLITKEDFERKKGRSVKIETKELFAENKKDFTGIIAEVEEDGVIVGMDNNRQYKIPFTLIKKAKLKLKW